MDEELEQLQAESETPVSESLIEGSDLPQIDGGELPQLDADNLMDDTLTDGNDMLLPDGDDDLMASSSLESDALIEPEAATHTNGNFTESSATADGIIRFERIQQLKVKVQAMLGATPLSISELANLQKGDVIKLDTKIGDPISILANGDEIARAEIVVIQDEPPKFGLTLTEIIETNEDQRE